MNRPGTIVNRHWGNLTGVLARWILGGSYVYMGAMKALHPVEFLKLVRQYDLVHNAMVLDAIAAWLPWFEIACGLLLIAGMAVRGTALVSLAMLIPFTAAVLHRALALKSLLTIPFCMVCPSGCWPCQDAKAIWPVKSPSSLKPCEGWQPVLQPIKGHHIM